MKQILADNFELPLFFALIAVICAVAVKSYKTYLSEDPLGEYDMPHNELSELSDFEEGFSDN